MSREIPLYLEWFQHKSAKHDVFFFIRSGNVINKETWSETRVKSTGGLNGYAPRVSSHVSYEQEIWLREQDGTELSFRAKDNVKVNIGNDVSIVYGGTPEEGYRLALVNRTTGYADSIDGAYGQRYLEHFCKKFDKPIFGAGAIFPALLLLVFLALVSLIAWKTLLYPTFGDSAEESTKIGLIFTTLFFALLIFSYKKISSGIEIQGANDDAQKSGQAAFESHCQEICQSLF